MLPLSFQEFLDFHGYEVKEKQGPAGELRKRIYDAEGENYDPKELLEAYLKYGGMPGIADIGLDTDKVFTLLDGIYSTVVMRDILEREKRNGKPAVQTIQAYVGALLESYIFYEIKRFDIKGKGYLRILGKYYIVDIGLRNYLLGLRDMDIGHCIENIVYFELLRRGYDVAIGKIDEKEVDFIATNATEKIYFQVTESMNDPSVRERELVPLQKIRDNYEKIVLAEECNHPITQDGIKIVKLIDFLLDKMQ